MAIQQTAILNANYTYTVYDTVGSNVSLRFYDLNQTTVYSTTSPGGFNRTQLVTSGTPTIGISDDPTSVEFGNIIFGQTTPATAFSTAIQVFAGSQPGSILTPPTPLPQPFATSELQTSLSLIGNIAQTFLIPSTARLITFCTTGQNLVYYTTNGSTPNLYNAWFYSFGKETWDNNIPVSSTMKFLSETPNQLAIVVRY